ncbi:triose-phosphate isomerase [Kwoniella heveanensis CBS 569]|uniref:Triosephosphate isomerase n=1 Tax=Kwoniella heveanensis BCC8398 TaxID=1296120 RepID=A0A1B9H3D9_9TREE|nr:triose-phosphate isomerase [Kwoniella heveanensis BCC8398]OCF38771.1 triose-phosphate isomerase [Kwoniella heveanensis CBS 569]
MNGTLAEIETIVKRINEAGLDGSTEVVVAPPALYLLKIKEELKPPAQVSAQNSYTVKSGAFTGEISPDQLKDAGVHWVILGHSERRSLFGDTDKLVADKTKAAIEAGLAVIACIGESLEQREKDETQAVVERQLEAIAAQISEANWKDIVIAYEPVWAIGTGKVATKEQAQEVHANIRQWLAKRVSQSVADSTRIIYGGSVNGKNSSDLASAADIDGFLVGGASLKPEFIDICKSKA